MSANSQLAEPVRPIYPLSGGVPRVAVGSEQGKEDDKEGCDEEAAEEVTARNPRVVRRPAAPTKAMVLAHEVHHADYREWCEHCVAGKGVSHKHSASREESSGVEFSVDYAFMTADGQVGYKEDLEEECLVGASPVIVGYDHGSRSIWAMAADRKGATDSSMKWLDNKINESGHSGTKIVLKSDQEESIIALKKAVAIRRQSETVMIESPVRDSRANGSAERAVRTWAAQVRTLRHHLESRIKMKVAKDSALMSWLVSWSADVLTRYKVHDTGRTSYEHVTGHKGLQAMAAFGEKVMFKYTTDKNRRNKMETEWDMGYFVGVNPKTTEYIIAKGTGVFSCATIRRLQDDKAYDPMILQEVKISYQEYVLEGSRSTPVGVRIHSPAAHNPNPGAAPTVPRRTRLKPEDFIEHGYTIGCAGCEQLQLKSEVRRNHSDQCRLRLELEMAKSSSGQERLDRAKDRLDARTAEIGQPDVATSENNGVQGQGEMAEEDIAEMFMDGPESGEDASHPTEEGRRPETQEFHMGTPVSSRGHGSKRKFNSPADGDHSDEEKFGRFERSRTVSCESDTELNPDEIDEAMAGVDSMDLIDRKILSAAILGVDITEVYSPERVAKVARRYGLVAGSSMDLTTGYDFTIEAHKRLAWKKVREEAPFLLIGSPPCTYFSMLQELNIAVNQHKPGWLENFEVQKNKAKRHVEF